MSLENLHAKQWRVAAPPAWQRQRVRPSEPWPRVPCRSISPSSPDPSGQPSDDSIQRNNQISSQLSSSAWPRRAVTFITGNFLPLALASSMALGVWQPELGAAAARTQLQTAVIVAMFIASGLQIKRGEAAQALRATGSVAYGLASIFLLGPLVLAPLILTLPLQPPAIGLGLAVFACMPTSLSSGIAMTQVGGWWQHSWQGWMSLPPYRLSGRSGWGL